MKNQLLIDLYLAAVSEKLFTWDQLKRFAKVESKYSHLKELEICEVYSEINKQYGNV